MLLLRIEAMRSSAIMSSVYSSGTYKNVVPTGNSTINALIAGTKGASGSAGAPMPHSVSVSFTVGNSGAQSSGAFGYGGEPDGSGQALNAVQISCARDSAKVDAVWQTQRY